jgi:hypothetical protein
MHAATKWNRKQTGEGCLLSKNMLFQIVARKNLNIAKKSPFIIGWGSGTAASRKKNFQHFDSQQVICFMPDQC